jgi:hypothetical protein
VPGSVVQEAAPVRARTRPVPRRPLLLALVLLGVLASSVACEPVATGEFSLLTYNVAGLPQEISTENPQQNIPLISPKLEPYDLVLTQEDFDWWIPALDALDFANYHTRLRAQTTHPHATGQHPGPAAVGIDGSDPERPLPIVGDGLGILSRFPMADVVRTPWEHCFGSADQSDGGAADCLAMKGFGVATVTLADGVVVDVYTVHGEAGRTPADNRMIAEDFALLADFVVSHSAGRAVIVAGDTNLHTEPGHVMAPVHTPIWNDFLAETGLTDVCVVVTCEAPGSIDKVAFAAGGGVTLEPLERRWEDDVFVDGDGADLSDHPPVAVDWRWTLWAA